MKMDRLGRAHSRMEVHSVGGRSQGKEWKITVKVSGPTGDWELRKVRFRVLLSIKPRERDVESC